jgi:hypothetical protein
MSVPEQPLLVPADLIPDRVLQETAEDAFGHAPIAARIGELVTFVEAPLNVALFAPWGAGKSSFGELLREDIGRRNLRRPIRQVTFIKYEAWRYVGESLKRNFIASSAAQLSLPQSRFPQFYRGLYEESRAFELSGRRMAWTAARFFIFMGAIFATVAIGWAGAYAIRAAVSDRAFWASFRASLSNLVGPFRTGALVLTVASALAGLTRVEVKRSAPSADEEFYDRFCELVETACRELDVDRVLFFIDELDRCPPSDVVAVLTAIKAFLSNDRCVFVVAADRQAVEQALQDELHQATAENLEQPYFSSAASFLEKIFQHEITLPPLRSARLTGFALDLVDERQGIWHELRSTNPNTLQEVAVALVPSHVRSPRQVKELLNNFATNMRIAQARQVAYLFRALEIARLTTLETCFPAFAATLRKNPHLLAALTRTEQFADGQLPGPLREIESWLSRANEDQLADSPVSVPLATVSRDLVRRQFDELVLYLQRTAHIQGPRADLLYLGPAAPELDPDDPSLADELELLATDAPDRVPALTEERGQDVLTRVCEFLAGMLDSSFGQERVNAMTALAFVAKQVGSDWPDRLRRAGAAVVVYSRGEKFLAEQLVGALRLVRAAEGPAGGPATLAIIREPALWRDRRWRDVIDVSSVFRERALEEVASQICETYNDEAWAYALENIGEVGWPYLKDALFPTIMERLKVADSEETAREIAIPLFDAASAYGEDRLLDLLELVLTVETPPSYSVARERAAVALRRS